MVYFTVNASGWGALGIYTTSLSWLILSTSQSIFSVGLFYRTASAASLLLSPFLSPSIGNLGKARCLTMISGTVRSAALVVPSISSALKISGLDMQIFIFLVAVLFGPSNTIFNAASEGLMLCNFPTKIRSTIAKRVGLVRQVALACGFAGAGFLVTKWDAQVGSAVAAILAMASAVVCLRLTEKFHVVIPMAPENTPSYLSSLTHGLSVIRSSPLLIFPCIVAALSFSVSHMSNALLAPIVITQHKSANTFGLISSAWAVGAIAAALWANLSRPAGQADSRSRSYLLVILGALCIAFSYTKSTPIQMSISAGIGSVFSYLRIMSDGDIALHTPPDKIASVLLTLSNLISLTVLAVYLMPWLMRSLAPGIIFALWGTVIVMAGLGILVVTHRRRRLTAPTRSPAPAPPDR